jgi:hypothetical protein
LALVKLGLSPEDKFILLQVKRRLGGKVEDVKP